MTKATLPNDIEALKDFALEQYQRAELLEHRLDVLTRKIFGRSSEQLATEQKTSGQGFFEFIELPAAPETAPEAERPEDSPKRKHGGGRKKIPAHLPRQRIEHTLPEERRVCPDCGQIMQPFGEETSEQYERIPARLFVLQHARIKYGCHKCECKPVIADVPNKVIDKGLAGPRLLAEIAVQKFDDHLPLNRQEKIFERDGCAIARSTMCAWMGVVAMLLTPLHRWMAARVLSSKKIHTDDTPIRVQDPVSGAMKTGRLWTYVGDDEHPYTVFDYTPSRSRDGPVKFLCGFKGYLQADAYGGYDCIYAGKDVIEAACWAHLRRKFYDSRDTDSRAEQALAIIGALYAIEARARPAIEVARGMKLPERQTALTAAFDARQQLRAVEAPAVLTKMQAWLEERKRDTAPKSPLGQAVKYALNQWIALTRFLENGALEVDNNIAENALRRVALGRKNYLFLGSDAGGKSAATIYSLIATCRRHGVNPSEYLADVLVRISTHPAAAIEDLAPSHWQPTPTV